MNDPEFQELVVGVLVAAVLIVVLMVVASHMGDTYPPLTLTLATASVELFPLLTFARRICGRDYDHPDP